MIVEGEFSWPVRVYYEDTDSGGVVYYANYLKFMERARTEWLRKLGYEQVRLGEEGLIFAVRRAELDYLKPAHLDDRLQVKSYVYDCGRVSIDFEQNIYRKEELLCRGRVRIVSLDAGTFRPRALPTRMRETIQPATGTDVKESR